ncbi:CRISPR-associated endonuclease Cas2 [Candidatus Uhrbacteria bacterium]|nr:CRISPR-associated endonuclease Cas2 [Candidatus Uhrbacteria bacterium]
MSTRLQLQELQIALLELQATNLKGGGIHVPSHVRWSLGGFGPVAYIERERARRKREYRRLMRRIHYLKQEHYIELVQEGEEQLYRLTAKGKYEILRIRFIQHMEDQRKQKWDRAWRVVIFDIPERLRKHRDHLRKLLKASGFQMWQFSVWVTKYNPEPALHGLLKYLGLHRYYALIEADCKKCSPRVIRVWRQMQRQKEDGEIYDLSPRAYFKVKQKRRKSK